MKSLSLSLSLAGTSLLLYGLPAQAGVPFEVTDTVECEVIVAGGSTAALAAALTSARQKQKTCLIEPTDWPGGQLTASGSSAIDFASHSLGGRSLEWLAKSPANNPSELYGWLQKMGSNPGQCWVSEFCYEPKKMLKQFILPAIKKEVDTGFLKPFYNTVIKAADSDYESRQISALYGVERTSKKGNGYQYFLSEVLADWYDPEDSPEFSKKTLKFQAPLGTSPTIIDATEFGDVLVLSGAEFLQAFEHEEGDVYNVQTTCGQAHVFPFVMGYATQKQTSPLPPFTLSEESKSYYSNEAFQRHFSWSEIWSYRRIRSHRKYRLKDWRNIKSAHRGDLSLQNWNPGNDYPFGYLFKSRSDTLRERPVWQGGINLAELKASENHALGWYQWLKQKSPEHIKPYLYLDKKAFGTGTGLSKLPYVRDTRRSIGMSHFIMTLDDIIYKPGKRTGTPFKDRVGIGLYKTDMHPMKCMYPQLTRKIHPIAPYYLPYRALTNKNFDNLLVAGKTMAQSFIVNNSSRVHMIEWSSGVAAGVAGAHMYKYQQTNYEVPEYIALIQAKIQQYSPIDWTS